MGKTSIECIGLKQEAEGMYKSGMCAKDICKRLDIAEKTFSTWKKEGKWNLKPDSKLALEMEGFISMIILVKPLNSTLHRALAKKWKNIREILLEKQLIPPIKNIPNRVRSKEPT